MTALSARFAPPEGQFLLIIGQDLDAVGGIASHAHGYVDQVPVLPGGITTYTPLPSLAGLKTLVNWGSGDVCAQYYLDAPRFENSTLAIGLSLGEGKVENVASGQHDVQIDDLAAWIMAAARPVYLRIGYEFEGKWNRYEPVPYVEAFRRIVRRFRELGVTNAAYVWQSATHHTPYHGGHELMDWFPGAEYVDWFGMSYFEPRSFYLDRWLALARRFEKPILIAEAAPRGHDLATQPPDEVWTVWFAPFFQFVADNRDVIRAVAYINNDWDAQPMWVNGDWGDTRVEANPEIRARWLQEISQPHWLHGAPSLFETLGYRRGYVPARPQGRP